MEMRKEDGTYSLKTINNATCFYFRYLQKYILGKTNLDFPKKTYKLKGLKLFKVLWTTY